jgi:carbamoyl-phosphate synthase large subunit
MFGIRAGADTLLGPEMRSTGEVMGIDTDFGKAYAKAAIASGQRLPSQGNIFITMIDKYKEAIVPIAKDLQVGFEPVTLRGRLILTY